jgi:hypothetical protein
LGKKKKKTAGKCKKKIKKKKKKSARLECGSEVECLLCKHEAKPLSYQIKIKITTSKDLNPEQDRRQIHMSKGL